MKRDGERTALFTRRALFLMAAQTGIIAALGTKLYQLQVREGARYAAAADNNRVSTRLLAATRGPILDRFGVTLAGNSLNWRALLLPDQTTDVSLTLDRFSQIVPIDAVSRARILKDATRPRKFIPIMVHDFLSYDDMTRIEVAAADLPGIIIDAGTKRHYPLGPDLAHVVGYVAPPNEKDMGDDPELALPGMRVGRAGIEQFHEDNLRGDAGEVQLEVNVVGRPVRELERQEGAPGDTVGLTIDSVLQQSIIALLGDETACATVLDCQNGEVLAMTTTPSFDPALFDSGISKTQWLEWTSNKRTPLINKACAGVYPPGSTFKMAVGLAGLRAGVLGHYEQIYCPGHLDLGDTRFHCWKKSGHGSVDLHDALKHSCDVFFYEVSRRAGPEVIAEIAGELGLGVDCGIDLPGARRGLVPTPAWRERHHHRWNEADSIVSGIGQGFVLATPLQLAAYTARVATGRAVQPHVTRMIGGDMQTGSKAEDWQRLAIPEADLAIVRGGMLAVVNEKGGTAPKARMREMLLAGKTGSSQVRRVSRWAREHGQFNSARLPWEFRPHALFVCFAPFDAPRYAVSVVVEHGNAGADVAAPLAKEIMELTTKRDPARRVVPPGASA
jgi:penicillin-binding protein 2